jgi:hypothetical protein
MRKKGNGKKVDLDPSQKSKSLTNWLLSLLQCFEKLRKKTLYGTKDPQRKLLVRFRPGKKRPIMVTKHLPPLPIQLIGGKILVHQFLGFIEPDMHVTLRQDFYLV